MPKKIKKRAKTNLIDLESISKVKMSEVLSEYAEPLLKEAKGIDNIRIAIAIAVMCWNIALMPDYKQDEIFKDTLAKISKINEDYETTKEIMKILIERKKMFYSEYNKFILDYEIVPLDDGNFHLIVGSAEFGK